MATRGRKPKPAALKVIQGNPGKRRIEPDAAIDATGPLGDPPDYLSERAAEHWREVGATLEAAGIACEVDRDVMALYCDAWARWREARELAEKMPPVLKNAKGVITQNPVIGVANRAHDQVVKLMPELGLTPSARMRVKANPPAKNSNPFAGRGDVARKR